MAYSWGQRNMVVSRISLAAFCLKQPSNFLLVVGVFFFKFSYLFVILDTALLLLSRIGPQVTLAEAHGGEVGRGIKTVAW